MDVANRADIYCDVGVKVLNAQISRRIFVQNRMDEIATSVLKKTITYVIIYRKYIMACCA